MSTIVLDGESLTLDKAVSALNPSVSIKLSPQSKRNIRQTRAVIETAVHERKIVYGVTTGFGAFSNVIISRSKCRLLQENIVRSHAAGVGLPLPDDIVRLIMLLMVNSKAKGYSGLRLSTVETLLGLIQR